MHMLMLFSALFILPFFFTKLYVTYAAENWKLNKSIEINVYGNGFFKKFSKALFEILTALIRKEMNVKHSVVACAWAARQVT